jgi:Ca2+-binding RTX toxin-like protein
MASSTTIRIKIDSTTGSDTKYLFPGAMPHKVTGVNQAGIDYSLYMNGVASGGYRINVSPYPDYSAITLDGWDIHGFVTGWSVSKTGGSAFASLYYDPFSAHNLKSLSWVTLDGLVGEFKDNFVDATVELKGNIGNDTLRGSFWNDRLDGGAGADSMIGGDGDDRYYINTKLDKVVEVAGQGRDTVVTRIDYTLAANLEGLVASGTRNFKLIGNSASNGMEGSSGADTISGLSGNDTIVGWGGRDALYGGKGKDSFLFLSNPLADVPDTIKDFRSAEDKIMVLQTAFVGLFPTYVAASAFPIPIEKFHKSTSGAAHDASDRIIYDTDNGNLYFDPDGKGGHAGVLFATLTGHPSITAADIWII